MTFQLADQLEIHFRKSLIQTSKQFKQNPISQILNSIQTTHYKYIHQKKKKKEEDLS